MTAQVFCIQKSSKNFSFHYCSCCDKARFAVTVQRQANRNNIYHFRKYPADARHRQQQVVNDPQR